MMNEQHASDLSRSKGGICVRSPMGTGLVVPRQFCHPTLESDTVSSFGNSSELRGNQEPAAFQEGIEAPGPPGPEEGCQGHFAAADFT